MLTFGVSVKFVFLLIAMLQARGVCPVWACCNKVKVSCFMNNNINIKLDYGNCKFVRICELGVIFSVGILRIAMDFSPEGVLYVSPG